MKRTTAAGSSGGAYVDYSAGIQPGTLLVAEDRNNLQEELAHAIEAAGWALDSGDQYQLARSIIAMSHQIGDVIMPELKLVPITVAASRSTTNPSFPHYLPIIDRTAADVDVPSTQAPDLVTEFRAYAASVLGSASFTATVAASVLTFANTATNNALLKAISEDALVQRWLSSGQSAVYAASNEDFANGRCINVAGTDYAIAGINLGARTLTVTGTPTSGSQTVIFYPYRIAGSTTSVRLHRLSGFVPVASGDADGAEISGMRHMDAGQQITGTLSQNFGDFGSTASGAISKTANVSASAFSNGAANRMHDISFDSANSANARTNKNTSPRSHARHAYTWVGRLLT